MLPPVMQPHSISVVTPDVVAGEYGVGTDLDYDSPTPRVTRAFVQPVAREEISAGADRQALPYEYVAYTNDTSIARRDLITWNGKSFEVTGIQTHYTTRGASHVTVELHSVEG